MHVEAQIKGKDIEIESLRKQYEHSLETKERSLENDKFELVRRHKNELEECKQINEKTVNDLQYNFNRQLDTLKDSSDKVIQKLEEANERLEAKLQDVVTTVNQKLEAKEEEMTRKKEREIQTLTVQFEGQMKQKEDLINKEQLRHDKIVGETQDQYRRLQEQLKQTKVLLKKVQGNSQNMNNQFIQNLNAQKEQAEQEIQARNDKISVMERNMKKISDESVDRFNSLNRKLTLANDELKDVSNRYNKMKAEASKYELQANQERAAHIRNAEITSRATSELSLAKSREESYQKQLTEAKSAVAAKDAEIYRFKGLLARVTQADGKYKTEIANLREENEKLSKQKNEAVRNTQTRDSQLATLQGALARAKTALQREFSEKVRIAVQEKNKELQEVKKELADTIRYMNECARLQRDFKSKLNQMTQALAGKQSDLEKLRQEATARGPDQRDQHIKKLNDQIFKLKQNFTTTMNSLSREKSQKDTELIRLRENAKTIEQKEAQIVNLNNNITNMQQTYKNTLNAITAQNKKNNEELEKLRRKSVPNKDQTAQIVELTSQLAMMKKKFIEALNVEKDKSKDKIADLEKKMETAGSNAMKMAQKFEQMKLDHLRQIQKATSLPSTQQEEFNKLKEERKLMEQRLKNTTLKLEKLQFEFASASAIIKVKNEEIEKRTKHLEQEEERIRTEPPRLLDPMFKEGRDRAMQDLRKTRVELNGVKEQVLELTQKLHIAEGIVEDQSKEKTMIKNSQVELKRTFVDNLNRQQTAHEKELARKDERIKDLEKLLMSKVEPRQAKE
jgi:chromosome segregation ATPase